MAKRMKYSVVGLPHYTIWHLYEPSVDDLRHMEEMEQERKQREEKEKEEKAEAERQQKIKDRFKDSTDEMETDGAAVKKKIGKTQTQEDGTQDLYTMDESEERPAAAVKGGKKGAASPKDKLYNTQEEETSHRGVSNDKLQ